MAEKKKDVKSPVDLMVHSPRMTGDGFPSPSLPRKSDSIAGSPIIGTPIATSIPISPKKRDSVTVSGRDILAKEEENKNKVTKLVSGGVVVESPIENILASPILVRKNGTQLEDKVNGTSDDVEEIDGGADHVNEDIVGNVLASPILVKKSSAAGVEGLEKAMTGLGIEDGEMNGEVSK
jgi:hypothetical protein